METAIRAVFGVLIVNNYLLLRQINSLEKNVEYSLGYHGEIYKKLKTIDERIEWLQKQIITKNTVG